MKSIRYCLTSLLLLMATHTAFACWTPIYPPGEYYIYRVYTEQSALKSSAVGNDFNVEANCREWQKLTSYAIPLEEIYEVVYKMPLERFEALYDNKGAFTANKFVEWITQKDTTILDFLLLAKTNEFIRSKRNSRWYYPSMNVGAKMSIEEIVEKSLSVTDARLRDRYLLQAVRALFTMAKYKECIELWESEASRLPKENLMRQLILPYIAGAEFRVKRTERALEYFAQLGDVESMLFCAEQAGKKMSLLDALEQVCKCNPNNSAIAETLQKIVRQYEFRMGCEWRNSPSLEEEHQQLTALSLKMIENADCNDPAMWYYTAAFLMDIKQNTDKASYFLTLAEKSKSTRCVNESIKVFRIYLDAKTHSYNADYERKLFAQLKWFDSKIVANMDKEVFGQTMQGYYLSSCMSYYYWNDVMRRIVLAEVCPRMIKAGKPVRALQLANMADNRLLELINERRACFSEGDRGWFEENSIFLRGRYCDNYNIYDYSNHFFEMIDSLGLNVAVKYAENVQKPLSEFDEFLNERGYTNRDYLNDIIGTQCLRNMRYAEAVKYLALVSKEYANHLNVHMELEPFCLERQKIEFKPNFRYHFASEMNYLEQKVDATKDPNLKAQLMVKYAVGLRNSFDRCWELTQYYKGEYFPASVCTKREWEKDAYTMAAMDKVEQLVQMACDIATDDEVAANIQYEWCNFKTVAQKYPHTRKGQLVRGECDKLHDYHPNLRQDE